MVEEGSYIGHTSLQIYYLEPIEDSKHLYFLNCGLVGFPGCALLGLKVPDHRFPTYKSVGFKTRVTVTTRAVVLFKQAIQSLQKLRVFYQTVSSTTQWAFAKL